ncbi:hypothetical protein DTF12_22950 [Salmonella enterica subsp. salamae]|nr:hypothetical protein [Salmonella enterica subsp. salamae]
MYSVNDERIVSTVFPGECFVCELRQPEPDSRWKHNTLCEAPEMKYVFIEKHQAEFSIKAMCRVLQVARSGWCIWHQCYQRCESDPYPTPEIRSRG